MESQGGWLLRYSLSYILAPHRGLARAAILPLLIPRRSNDRNSRARSSASASGLYSTCVTRRSGGFCRPKRVASSKFFRRRLRAAVFCAAGSLCMQGILSQLRSLKRCTLLPIRQANLVQHAKNPRDIPRLSAFPLRFRLTCFAFVEKSAD